MSEFRSTLCRRHREVCIYSVPLYMKIVRIWCFSQETALILQVWRKRVLAALQKSGTPLFLQNKAFIFWGKRSKHYWHQDMCEDPLYLKRRIGKMPEKGVGNHPESRPSAIFYRWRMDYYFKSPTMKTHGYSICLRQRLDQDIRADPNFATLS